MEEVGNLGPHVEPLAEEVRARLERVSTATLSSQLLGRGLKTRFVEGVRPLRPDLRLVGVARTLRYVPVREDLVPGSREARWADPQRTLIDAMGPGQVLVIDSRGNRHAATLGSILATRIMMLGGAGIVSDGNFRDYPEIQTLDLPTYARGAHANPNTTALLAVQEDGIIGCGGVLVMPGDVVVGDAEGVIVIPRDLAGEVSRDAKAQEEKEAFIMEQVRQGEPLRGTYPMGDELEERYRRRRGE